MAERHSSESPESTWRHIRPVLDDALHELAEADRVALVLRFFENLSLREVGTQLGVNENAARMRVDRALGKLQELLSRRGISSTSSALAVALVAGAVVSAPAGLAAIPVLDMDSGTLRNTDLFVPKTLRTASR